MVEINHGRVTFLQGRELMMELHATGSGLRGEHAFKTKPDSTGCGTFDDMGEDGFRERGDESTQDHLILGVPIGKFWVGKSSGSIRSGSCNRGWRGGVGAVNEAIEMLASKIRDDLVFPEKVIISV